MSFHIAIRLIGMALFAAAGFFLGLYLSPIIYGAGTDTYNDLVVYLTLIGAIIGLLLTPYVTVYPIRWVRNRLRLMPPLDLVAMALGMFIGLLMGALLAWPLSLLPGWLGDVAPTVVTLLLAYLGVYIATQRKRDMLDAWKAERTTATPYSVDFSAASRAQRMEALGGPTNQLSSDMSILSGMNGQLGMGLQAQQGAPGAPGAGGDTRIQLDKYLLVDTSAIIDGRIADISKAGFLDGILLVPRFVLQELQYIADSADALRRARGRRGLDMLNRLQKEAVVPLQISEVDADDVTGVDSKLVKVARLYHCPIITNDFNLNRVAELQGVKVLNINELANAVKPVVLPGEEMHVLVIQEGKEFGQGVAYLDDGTMVVVENGRKFMNSNVDVVVTRVLQTVAGRMIFAQMKSQLSNGKAAG
ncbi:MAG TPA: PIN domain-containing protein [Chloroflexia bacterium]|nr:PIN domain-containing protein [Chloroflexia bacterium]